MTLNVVNYEGRVREAVKTFWQSRLVAGQGQEPAGTQGQGERGNIATGKNMDGFTALAAAIVRENGLREADIHVRPSTAVVPGFFRSSREWDLLVAHQSRLIAAIGFKSQVGPLGNNLNNRAEETIGSAQDFWTAYREGAFGSQAPRPFLGWLTLLEDCAASRSTMGNSEPNFPVFKEFVQASYAERFNLLCRRLVREQLCTSAAVAGNRSAPARSQRSAPAVGASAGRKKTKAPA